MVWITMQIAITISANPVPGEWTLALNHAFGAMNLTDRLPRFYLTLVAMLLLP